jgi:hypothetical protein
VRASFPGYEIEGELDATFRPDGKECIGTIRVLRMSVQGHSREHAKALLEQSFSEYCEGLATLGDLYPILLDQGFRPAPAGGRGSSQYLFIKKFTAVHGHEDSRREQELELANA